MIKLLNNSESEDSLNEQLFLSHKRITKSMNENLKLGNKIYFFNRLKVKIKNAIKRNKN